MYIADSYSNTIRKVNASTGIITTIAGNGTAGYSGDGGPATRAEFNQLRGLALTSSGNVYIADGGNNVIRELTVSTGVITTVAGTGTAGFAGDGGPATAAEFDNPVFVAVDSAGNLYISDQYIGRVREVNASTGIIQTIAGGGPSTSNYVGDGGAATSAMIYWTEGLAFDSAGNLYVADKNFGRIRKVDKSTGAITTVKMNMRGGWMWGLPK